MSILAGVEPRNVWVVAGNNSSGRQSRILGSPGYFEWLHELPGFRPWRDSRSLAGVSSFRMERFTLQ